MREMNWEKAKFFHGHECPGLAIGVRVCEAVHEKMKLGSSFDEEIICITENNACCVDAIQVIMSCTMGKGNLIYKDRGKIAFTFINRANNYAMRFYFKDNNNGMDRESYIKYILESPIDNLFLSKEIDTYVPEKTRFFETITCDSCFERAAENKIRIQNGQKVCLDCFIGYSRRL